MTSKLRRWDIVSEPLNLLHNFPHLLLNLLSHWIHFNNIIKSYYFFHWQVISWKYFKLTIRLFKFLYNSLQILVITLIVLQIHNPNECICSYNKGGSLNETKFRNELGTVREYHIQILLSYLQCPLIIIIPGVVVFICIWDGDLQEDLLVRMVLVDYLNHLNVSFVDGVEKAREYYTVFDGEIFFNDSFIMFHDEVLDGVLLEIFIKGLELFLHYKLIKF